MTRRCLVPNLVSCHDRKIFEWSLSPGWVRLGYALGARLDPVVTDDGQLTPPPPRTALLMEGHQFIGLANEVALRSVNTYRLYGQ